MMTIQTISALLLMVFSLLFPDVPWSKISSFVSHGSTSYAVVERVIDGDTIVLTDGRKVRYIGIDTPELQGKRGSECYAVEAKSYNAQLVKGVLIRMERDVSDTDRYKRLLRYVYVGDRFINEDLVSNGYAVSATYPPDVRHQNRFVAAQKQARDTGRGLWSACSDY